MQKVIICVFSLILIFVFFIKETNCQGIGNRLLFCDEVDLADNILADFCLDILNDNLNTESRIGLSSRSSFNMKLDSIYGYRRINGVLKKTGKTELYYDDENNRELKFSYTIDEVTGQYVPSIFEIIKFDKKDLLKKYTLSLWDGNYDNLNEDLAYVIQEFTYNDSGALILYEDQNYGAIQAGVVLNQLIRDYDASGNVIKNTWNRWDASADKLTLSQEFNYSYNANNLLKEEIRYRNHVERGWEKTDSIIYEYYEVDVLMSKTTYHQVDVERLALFEKELYNYTNDKLTSLIEYGNYKEEVNEFRIRDIIEYEYDSFNNLISSDRYDSTIVISDRTLISSERFTHDNNILSEEVQLPRSNVWDINSVILERSKVNPILVFKRFSGGDIDPQVQTSMAEYFYSDIETSSTSIELIEPILKISPNPTSDFITLDIDHDNKLLEVSILDIQGQLITKANVSANQSYDVSQLEQGIYFCKVRIDNDIVTKRFVKM